MRESRQLPFLRLWLAGTLVFLLGTGLVMRPDRDAAQIWQLRSVSAEQYNVGDRQLLARIRLLQNEGLSQDQIETGLLGQSALSRSLLRARIELSAALQAGERAEQRLTHFLVTATVPPLIALEIGLLLALMGRRPKALWSLRRNPSKH